MSSEPSKKIKSASKKKAPTKRVEDVTSEVEEVTSGLGLFTSEAGPAMLTDEQRKTLVEQVSSETTLIGMAHKYVMQRVLVQIPSVRVGSRIARANQPGDSVPLSTAVTPDHGIVELRTAKLVLPWVVTEEFLEDNPDGRSEHLILRMMGLQLAHDLEDLAINGDEGRTTEPLLRSNDGFLRLARDGGRVLDKKRFFTRTITANDVLDAVQEIPAKYRNRLDRLVAFVNHDTYMDLLRARIDASGLTPEEYDERVRENGEELNIEGVRIKGTPYMPEGKFLISDPDNLVVGVHKDFQLRTTSEGKNAIDFDERYYALHGRFDFAIQNLDAVVLVEVTLRDTLKAARSALSRVKRVVVKLINSITRRGNA